MSLLLVGMTSPATAPLRHLLRHSEPWDWSKDVHKAFVKAKKIIANKVEEGVRLFNPKLPTGLLLDWCGEGMGHILCQKHCNCPDKNNLNCCEERRRGCSVIALNQIIHLRMENSQLWWMPWRRLHNLLWAAVSLLWEQIISP